MEEGDFELMTTNNAFKTQTEKTACKYVLMELKHLSVNL